MTNRWKYKNGNTAVNVMEFVLESMWREASDIENMNQEYQEARDAAVAFDMDVSKYPRKIRWSTQGLNIVERAT